MNLSAEARALLHKAADQIEAHPEQFNMSDWGGEYNCGTVACIAGHIVIASGEGDKLSTMRSVPSRAAELLDLDPEKEWDPIGASLDRLFLAREKEVTMPRRWRHLSGVPADQAVRTIRHFAETGDVDWSV
jgi:hypothetical protein